MTAEQLEFPVRLKKWRDRVEISQDDARLVLGIGRSYYSRLESGKKKPGKFLVEKFDLIEQEPVSSVLEQLDLHHGRIRDEARAAYGVRSKPPIDESRVLKVRKIPQIGWAQAGEAVDFEAVVEWEKILTVETNDPKAIAIRIRGDSMMPRYPDGSIVVVACSERAKNDDLVIARLRDEGVVFKKLQVVDPKRGILRLISFNEQYTPIERSEDQFVWIYPVEWVMERTRKQ